MNIIFLIKILHTNAFSLFLTSDLLSTISRVKTNYEIESDFLMLNLLTHLQYIYVCVMGVL